MENVILKSFSVSNFRSFKDGISFTTEVDYNENEFGVKNAFDIKGHAYNKVSYIFGTNSVGKTNLCKAVEQVQDMIISLMDKVNLNNQVISNKKSNDYFKFECGYKNVPTTFAIEVLIGKIIYLYTFKILNEIIIEEKLYKKDNQLELILNRSSSTLTDVEVESELINERYDLGYISNGLEVHIQERILLLPLIAKAFNPLAKKITDAILSVEIIEMQKVKNSNIFIQENYNDERLKKYLEIIKLQEPTLRAIEIISFDEYNDFDYFNDEENAEDDISNFRFRAVYNLYKNNEVVGERRVTVTREMAKALWSVLSVMPSIFNTLEYGGVLIIDDIEESLNPNLIKTIVDLFYDEEKNIAKGQLICTSNNQSLVEGEIRPDQVWLLNKESCGKSVLTRLSNEKVRPTENSDQKDSEEAAKVNSKKQTA